MKDKKKIAILTLYYKNNNYGGIAQAFALCKYINNLGFSAEVISFNKGKGLSGTFKDRVKVHKTKGGINGSIQILTFVSTWIINKLFKSKLNKKRLEKYSEQIELRNNKFEEFRKKIPHSKVYNSTNIYESISNYDVFISGSDQIWKPGVIQDEFVCKFVPETIPKISYASSVTIENIKNRKWFSEYLKENLNRYSYISVRESETQKELNEILSKKVEWVVDPTLLLEKEEWKEYVGKSIVKDKYIFTYMLGDNKKQKDYITDIARRKNLKIVTLPFVNGKYVKSDIGFGDYRLFDVGVEEFLTLINNAEIVMTDSFHAVCFSRIFEKEFYVFEREVNSSADKMNSRIVSILSIMGVPERLINYRTNLNCIDKINYELVEERLSKYIQKSRKYLDTALYNL